MHESRGQCDGYPSISQGAPWFLLSCAPCRTNHPGEPSVRNGNVGRDRLRPPGKSFTADHPLLNHPNISLKSPMMGLRILQTTPKTKHLHSQTSTRMRIWIHHLPACKMPKLAQPFRSTIYIFHHPRLPTTKQHTYLVPEVAPMQRMSLNTPSPPAVSRLRVMDLPFLPIHVRVSEIQRPGRPTHLTDCFLAPPRQPLSQRRSQSHSQ